MLPGLFRSKFESCTWESVGGSPTLLFGPKSERRWRVEPTERVREAAEPVLAAAGFELFDVELRSQVLRVYVDRPGGIDLEAVSAAAQLVSELLDRDDPLPDTSYTLEVSSPGVERPLRTPDHFRRHIGTTVSVKTTPEVPGERRLQGRLDGADDTGIDIVGRRLAYDEIERAKTVFEWGPAPKPSPAKKKKKKASA